MPLPESMFMSSDVYRKLRRAESLLIDGEWSAADECYASAIAEDKTPTSRIAFASSLAERERYYESICEMTNALDLATVHGNRAALSVIFHNLAAIYRELGDVDLAQRFQQRSLLQLDDCGSEELLGLANNAWLADRRELAEGLAQSAAEMGEPPEYGIESDPTCAMFGALNGGNIRDSIRGLLRAYRIHRAQSAYRLMGTDLLNLSLLFAEINRPLGEIACVQDAVHCFEKAGASISADRARRLLSLLTRVQSVREFDPSRN